MDELRTTLRRYEFPGGWSEAAIRGPHPALVEHVSRYWGYVERIAQPVKRREVPTTDIVVALSFGPKIHVLGAHGSTANTSEHCSFVAGLFDEPVVTEHDGVQEGIEFTLTPLGARALFGLPMAELAHRVVAFDDVFGRESSLLLERLYDTRTWDARIEILESVLARRIADAPPVPRDVAWGWRRLTATDGRASVRALADELGRSTRHLTSQFREFVGLPPKLFASILRFRRALRLLEDAGRTSRFAEIALDCGYYDQAHFNRDFRRFAGSTPRDYLARRFTSALGIAVD